MTQRLMIEMSQTLVTMAPLADSGDHSTFVHPSILFLSGYANDDVSSKPVVRPNGLINGALVSPTAVNNEVKITAGSFNINGVKYSGNNGDQPAIAEDTLTLTRGTAPNVYKIISIIADSTGYSAVDGTAFTAWDNSGRGGSGQPPYIPVDAVEVAQVWLNSDAAGFIERGEIKAVPGQSQEVANFPTYDILYARVVGGAQDFCGVKFISPLPLIHTGGLAKNVYLEGYEADFVTFTATSDVVMPAISTSVASTTFYEETIGARAETLNAGSFNIGVKNSVRDSIFAVINTGLVWVKHYPDKNEPDFSAVQGYLNGTPPNPAGAVNTMAVTVSAEKAYINVKG